MTKSTDLVPIRRASSKELSLLDIQERIARDQIAETRTTTSSRKSRVEQAQLVFAEDPATTLVEIQQAAKALADTVDPTITPASAPLTKAQINRLSDEFIELERLRIQVEALYESRYRQIVFAHLDETVKPVPGRPITHVPGKIEPDGPGDRFVFSRTAGNREAPDVNVVGMREVLPPEIVAQVYITEYHPPVPEWREEVFDEGTFSRLVDEGRIDLDVVADFLTPGKLRTPSFCKTLVKGDQS